jgi:biopolymer transport protein ExbD
MKVDPQTSKGTRIEMIPLIDMVFLLLVFFIYGMLSMAVHRSLPVQLPASSTAPTDQKSILSVTIHSDGSIDVDKERIPLVDLKELLRLKSEKIKESGLLLFADREVSYQRLFFVLDEIRAAGFSQISLQAERKEER